jgi:putative endonuclease
VPNGRQVLGRNGENLAARWYAERGYDVVARNWRCPQGEADIIALRRGVLVVCEVKTRSSDRFGSPAEAVTLGRQRRLRQTALRYLQEHSASLPGGRPRVVRFDVAEVLNGAISVIEEAF